MIHISGKGERLARFRLHVAGQAFAVKCQARIELVFGGKRSGFCEDMARPRIVLLNFGQRSVFSKNGQRIKKDGEVRPGFPIRQIVAHEIRAEEIGPVAARAVALRGAGKIELRIGKKRLLNLEAGGKRIFRILRDEQAEKIWSHAGVEILADLQRDFDLLTQWRGDMLCHLIFRSIEMLE